MPIYLIVANEDQKKARLVTAANKAQAIAHVASKMFTVEACGPEEVAAAFIDLKITAVEKAGTNGE